MYNIRFQGTQQAIVRKLHPIPKISTTLQELEGFTYATTLDLNMGYYIIRLDPTAAETCTIIFPWGKYSYQRLLMGFSGSADIFQLDMGSLMATLEYIRAYIEDLAEILRDPYSKKSPLLSIGDFPRLTKLSSHRVLGQSRIQQRHTCYNHPRIDAQ